MKMMESDIIKWRVSIALGILILIVFLGLFFPIKLHAAITNPYTVDEKPRVWFGDTVEINTASSTYIGMENYQQNYVDNFLHINFTYTHHRCCYASYPPGIYITNIDPRSTTTINVKLQTNTYMLTGAHPTNWYSFDIQFDLTGYSIVIKEAGNNEIYNEHINVVNLTETDWFALANGFPFSENNTPNDYSMSFTPIPIKNDVITPPPPTRNPVIIIPGIMGSYLNNEDGSEVWMNINKIIFSRTDSHLDDLLLSSTGVSVMPIFPSAVIKNTFKDDFFNKLIEELKIAGYTEEKDLFVFAYDWRKDIYETSEVLKQKIEEIKNKSESNQVDVIAHSMGGLVTKAYISKNNVGSINKFINIGTPHTGAPKAFKIINYGDDLNTSILFGLVGINSEKIKYISQNMPSIYQLLPSEKYLSEINSSYIYDLDDINNDGIRGRLTFDQTKKFLEIAGRNSYLISKAENFHNELDDLNPENYGISTYNIVGCGTQTLGKIFILNKEDSGGVEYNISYVNGDGTVPLKSAQSLPTENVFYYKNATHALMPSALGVKELSVAILQGNLLNINDFNQVSKLESDCPKISGQVVSLHSPIDLHIYDSQNRHTGPTENNDIENDIPGVSYEIIEGNKFAFLPDGYSYKIIGKAISDGSFNARIEKIENEIITETKYFNNVSITSTTLISFKVNSNTDNQIQIDNNSDGISESSIYASAVLNQTESSDINKPQTDISLKGNKTNDGSFISSVQVSLIAADDNSGILKTEYSTNNGMSWNKYIEPFTINIRGGMTLRYRSTDKAGNIESVKASNINIIYPANSGKKN